MNHRPSIERSHLIDQLAHHSKVFRALFTGSQPEERVRGPAPEKWCALQIVRHLHAEEREDFRARLAHVLNKPDDAMPTIDPAA